MAHNHLQQTRELTFRYLPEQTWMKNGGYQCMPRVGLYEHRANPNQVYTINVLSQSGLFVLRHNDVFRGARVITTDEELRRFLLEVGFPLPG
jgi:hypothetical protein